MQLDFDFFKFFRFRIVAFRMIRMSCSRVTNSQQLRTMHARVGLNANQIVLCNSIQRSAYSSAQAYPFVRCVGNSYCCSSFADTPMILNGGIGEVFARVIWIQFLISKCFSLNSFSAFCDGPKDPGEILFDCDAL